MSDVKTMTKENKTLKEHTKEFIHALVVAGFFALLIRTFFFSPFVIPSGSMKPNLLIGDFLFVSKYSYGISKYSFPFAPPLFDGKFFDHNAERGDVIVFRPVHRPDQDWIKRVVGLPGDSIQMKNGVLYINGKECLLEKQDTPFVDHLELEYRDGAERRVYSKEGDEIDQYVQTLPNGLKHTIIKKNRFGEGPLDDTPLYAVPEGHYFAMGDNRDGSDDSRNMRALGFVPHERLIGKAQFIFFSTSAQWWEVWKWLTSIRFNRIFTWIR